MTDDIICLPKKYTLIRKSMININSQKIEINSKPVNNNTAFSISDRVMLQE